MAGPARDLLLRAPGWGAVEAARCQTASILLSVPSCAWPPSLVSQPLRQAVLLRASSPAGQASSPSAGGPEA